MRIGIDVRKIVFQQMIGGLAIYPYNLIKHLSKIDKENEYILFHSFVRPKNYKFIKDLETSNFKNRVFRCRTQFLEDWVWDRFHLPIELLVGKVDIFHQTFSPSPPQLFGKSIVTIYDSGVGMRECLNFLAKKYELERAITLKRADFIITISHHIKNYIREVLKIPQEKIGVTYLGVGEEYYPINDKNILNNIRKKYNLNRKYLLYVGNLSPRKNVGRLVEAFYELKNNVSEAYNLVIAGCKWRLETDEILKKVQELNLKEDVIFINEIPMEDMPGLYSSAEVFVFPTLVEGFGLPVVEAMACGTPIIASATTATAEVVEDAGILVNPYNVAEITQAMGQVLTNTTLANELREKGIQRAKFFSWEKTANETLKIYKMVSLAN
ncbi:MAG: glycosyltransferase family 1 protein [bacterium]